MLKVFYDGYIFALQRHGGINVIYREILKRIGAMDGFDCGCTFPAYNICEDMDSIKKFIIPKVRPGRFFPRVWQVLNEFHLSRYTPDIFQSTYFSEPLLYKKCRKVLTVYDMIPEIFPGEFSGKYYRFLIALKRKLARNADAVVCISDSTKRDLLRFYPDIKETKVSVVHPACDEIFSAPVSGDEKREFRSRNSLSRPYLLYVGMTAAKYKNFDALLDAYCSAPELHNGFDLVVVTPDSFTESQMRKITPFRNSVKRFSGLAALQLKLLYNCAAVFVYPSKYEGFGIPILEAMACGAPVAAAHSGSLPEAGGNASVYFDPLSRSDLAAAIFSARDSAADAANAGARAENLKRFSWQETSRKISDVYRKVQ